MAPTAAASASPAEAVSEPNWTLLKFAPVAAASVALGVIGHCYTTAKHLGHLPRGASTPPISLFGVSNPEYRVYACGMTAVAGLFVSMARPLNSWLSNAVPPSLRQDVTSIYYSGLGAFAGLAVHGIIPLQADIVQIIEGRRDLEMIWTTQAHQMAAGVFFTASLYHGWNMLQLQCDERAAALPISWARCPLSVVFKGGGLIAGLLPLFGSMVYHPANKGHAAANSLDMAGILQYGVVGGIILMYVSYAYDFWVLQRDAASRGASAVVTERGKASKAE
jgi:hypothetical protein